MAGSIGHCLNEGGNYCGTDALENMGDTAEAVDEMMFVILDALSEEQRQASIDKFYRCMRREEPWPEWWRPD